MNSMTPTRKRPPVQPGEVRKKFARARLRDWTSVERWREAQAAAMRDHLTERLLLHAARNAEQDKKWLTIMLAIAYGSKWPDIARRKVDREIDR